VKKLFAAIVRGCFDNLFHVPHRGSPRRRLNRDECHSDQLATVAKSRNARFDSLTARSSPVWKCWTELEIEKCNNVCLDCQDR
jgi:hypothetical protein